MLLMEPAPVMAYTLTLAKAGLEVKSDNSVNIG
jgi:hypothetical protein